MRSEARSSTRDDIDKVKDSLQKIKAENRKLRKENSQLRKELNKTLDSDFNKTLDTEEEDVNISGESTEKESSCPKCKQPSLISIPAGKYQIRYCKPCGYKKRLEITLER